MDILSILLPFELRLYTFNIRFMYENLKLFVLLTMNKFTSIFCNVSFDRQYNYHKWKCVHTQL